MPAYIRNNRGELLNNTMKYYQFLYYNLIKIWLNKKDEIENAPINGIITITFLPFVNLVSIPLIIMAIFGTTFFNFPAYNKWCVVSFLAVSGFINYWILFRKGRSNKIIESFNKLDDKTLNHGYSLVIIYLIGSILIPLSIFFFVPPRF